MELRCKACNRKLDSEVLLDKEEGGLEDMCTNCRSLAYAEFDYANDHDHVLGSCQEGLVHAHSYRE